MVQAGQPNYGTQITISNGRRQMTRSVSVQYLITPKREGTFEIPRIEVKAAGKVFASEPQTFVAEQSETGDLLFVEIEGTRDKVYVGQPLELKLKIWLMKSSRQLPC